MAHAPTPATRAQALIAQAEADAAVFARGNEIARQAELIRNLKYHLGQVCIDVDTQEKLLAAEVKRGADTRTLYQRAVDPYAWTNRDADRSLS